MTRHPLLPADLREATDRMAEVALAAGAAILGVYIRETIAAERKADGSPLTEADLAAEAVIAEGLARHLPGLPVLSEEAAIMPVGLGAQGEAFLVVDPLDGTKEFLGRTGEFTVNIAIVAEGRPLAGVVLAPALGRLWLGVVGPGPGRGAGSGAEVREVPAPMGAGTGAGRAIAARARPGGGLVAVASRSHLDPETAGFLDALPVGTRRSIGSSLKFCLVAEGEADVYPRFGPTMEWDTAAGQAVLEAAGGRVMLPDGSAPLRYGKAAAGYRNGPFIAWGAAAPG